MPCPADSQGPENGGLPAKFTGPRFRDRQNLSNLDNPRILHGTACNGAL